MHLFPFSKIQVQYVNCELKVMPLCIFVLFFVPAKHKSNVTA